MPSNIEVKAPIEDWELTEATASRLSVSAPCTFLQEDIFFTCEGARLKLRIFGPDNGELIRYERIDTPNIRRSNYAIAHTSDPRTLQEILTRALGQSGVVVKTRTLYLIGQTRIHLDRVQDLGDFLELEVVLQPGQTDVDGKIIAEALLAEFGIHQRDLIGKAYVDLLAVRSAI